MNNLLIKVIFLVSASMMPSILNAELVWLDKVIVLVEDDVILDSELKRKTKQVTQQLLANKAELPSDEALKKQILERLIIDQIQLQMANRAGIRVSDEELNAALVRISEGNQATIAQMKEQLEADGMNFTLFREDIRKEILISRVRQGSVSRKIFISEQEVDDILVLMEGQGSSNIQYHLRHLMVAIPETSGPDEIDKARAKVASITQRFKDGTDFTQLVIEESDGSDALNGGDLGWRNIEQLPTLFAGSVTNLETGQLSEPIRSANGMHILKLEEKKGGFDKKMVDEVHIRHILIEISTVTSDAKAEAVLLQLRKDIVAGTTSFDEQAKVTSEDLSTASQGGDLGWAPPQAFQSMYGAGTLEKLKDGEMSMPFKGAGGWFIVERMASRTTDQTKEMKRMKARQILQSRKFDEEQESWLQEIREQAYVKFLTEDNS
ncbi:MAG: molecular chaperone SurA [Gammaproteobacteria bacterium]|nr:molecular chaperone SurA [Gammaproteobacteria bacterium]